MDVGAGTGGKGGLELLLTFCFSGEGVLLVLELTTSSLMLLDGLRGDLIS